MVTAVQSAVMMPDKFDNLFKAIITAGWNVKSDGEVDSPTGFFALVEIPADLGELAEMRDAVAPDKSSTADWPEAGWYITCENSDGLIFVFKCPHKTFAEGVYKATETQYINWTNGE